MPDEKHDAETLNGIRGENVRDEIACGAIVDGGLAHGESAGDDENRGFYA
jgi:hypothetical protein